MTIFASLPIVLFFILILVFKRRVLSSVLSSLFLLLIISLFVWQIDPLRLLASGIKGIFISFEIVLIIFGALLILGVLEKRGLVIFLKNIFESISNDKRVHVLIIGWGLIYFLEGIAGFGTPAIVAVPILIALGFRPINAVIISLIGDSVPVIFGAVGLPVTYGIVSGLSYVAPIAELTSNLTVFIAGLNVLFGILMPLIILFVFTKLEGEPFSHFREMLPFGLIAGLSVSIPAFATAYFIGPELPSIIGGLVGTFIIVTLAKKKILLPKTEKDNTLEPVLGLKRIKKNSLLATFPYGIVLLLLLVSRLPYLKIGDFLKNLYEFRVNEIFGFAIDYQFFPFYATGTIMTVSGILTCLLLRFGLKENLEILKNTGEKLFKPFIVLFTILFFVQIYLFSGDNYSGLPSMLTLLAEGASFVFGPIWPVLAPFVGGLGALASGSATVSNLIFSGFQYQTALIGGFSPILILSLQGLGAAAGNMVALHNIIAATVVAGIVGRENEVLKKTLPVAIFYLLVVGLIGLLISFVL